MSSHLTLYDFRKDKNYTVLIIIIIYLQKIFTVVYSPISSYVLKFIAIGDFSSCLSRQKYTP